MKAKRTVYKKFHWSERELKALLIKDLQEKGCEVPKGEIYLKGLKDKKDFDWLEAGVGLFTVTEEKL